MRFAGYAAIFDHPDRGGDIVRKGAFARAAKAGLPLLWQHDRAQRIGFIEHVEEDERGLRVIAQMDATAPPVADGAGLSFGYRVRILMEPLVANADAIATRHWLPMPMLLRRGRCRKSERLFVCAAEQRVLHWIAWVWLRTHLMWLSLPIITA